MVAPAGVSEGAPQEPVKAGLAPGGRPAGEGLSAAEAAAGELAAAIVEAGAGPAETASGEAEPGKAVPAGAGPASSSPAPSRPAETVPVEMVPVEMASAEMASTEIVPAEAELAEAREPDWDTAEERRDISLLAVVGIIFGIIVLVGAAVGVLAVVTHGFRPKTVITYRPAAVFGLRPGQCVNSGADALKVTVLSCARPHDAEVFAVFRLPDTAWPGTSAVQVDAGDGCANRFDSYIDPQLATASLTQEYVYPNQAAWQAGERTVVCEVRAESGQLTGSVRATG